MRHLSGTRSERAGSLLVLLSVLLLALAGAVYFAQPAAAQTQQGWLTVGKAADPEDDTPFDFVMECLEPRARNSAYSFTLMDPSDSQEVMPYCSGYVVTEVAPLPAGWQFDHVECDGGRWIADGRTVSVSPPALAVIPVTCTFYNELIPGRIIVKKVTSPVDAPDGMFGFDASFGGFSLAGGESHDSGLLPPGTYSVAEVVFSVGWSLVSASCSDGSSPAAIGLSPGEVVTCTFSNQYEEEGGSLTILKRTTPAGGAGFAFDGTLGPFTLDDGGSKTFDDLAAGEYAVTETPPAGWEFEAATCYTVPGAAVDYDVVGSGVVVNLAEGQDVICKFANREEDTGGPEGSLTVVKRTVPPGGTGFEFDAGPLGTFSLDDGGSETFTDLPAGSYTVTETPPADWEFASVECDALDWEADGPGVTVNLAEGEAAVCTFTNGELPYTGSPAWFSLLLAGLAALVAGLGVWAWSWMKEAQKA